MQHSSDIGGRDDNGVRFFARIYMGGKKLVLHPIAVPFGLGRCRIIFAGNRHTQVIIEIAKIAEKGNMAPQVPLSILLV
jgi:hypothetical protein